ncbi:MAG: extracellular solute-binding protein [Patescibacteria group bacterium]
MSRRLLIIVLAVSLLGSGCFNRNPGTEPTATDGPAVTLTVWRVFEKPEVMNAVVSEYKKLHPNVTINVLEKNFADYELEVANAIATGTGPDIWMIRNDWLPKHAAKLQPMPDGLLAGVVDKKKTAPSNLDVLQDRYPAVVTQDALQDDKVYGIPLSIDTLALYYNKDHFREAGLVEAPATWNEFVTTVKKLTKRDAADPTKIVRAGAAIGSARNVNRATDVLMLLMLQNGTQMVADNHASALFNGALGKTGGGLVFTGNNALEFYTGFADPRKEAYTWNNDQPNSIDAFYSGKVSMIFSYAYLERTLLQKNPSLNYGVSAMPQVDGTTNPVDYPTYWLEVVSRNTRNSAAAWQFMQFLSEEGDSLYQAAAGKPPAKKLAAVPKPDERVLNQDKGSPWVFQATTATDWYRGTNPGKVEQIFGQMIEDVTTFKQPTQVSIDNAAAQVTKLLQSKAGS